MSEFLQDLDLVTRLYGLPQKLLMSPEPMALALEEESEIRDNWVGTSGSCRFDEPMNIASSTTYDSGCE